MDSGSLLLLALVFFLASGISVITGSTSVITVPVMLQLGIDPRSAIATNMFALTFMSVGGTIPFLKGGLLNSPRLTRLVIATLLGSVLGALLLLRLTSVAISIVVSGAAIGLAIFSSLYRHGDTMSKEIPVSQRRELLGYALTFLLGIYGGLFSGGYVTILTTVFMLTFRMSLIQAIAATKLMNIFSSGIATAVFMGNELVDYRLGGVLALIMFIGAWVGGRYARRISEAWLQRIYLTAVWLLGLKALVFDLSKVSPPAPATTR